MPVEFNFHGDAESQVNEHAVFVANHVALRTVDVFRLLELHAAGLEYYRVL